MKKIIGQGAESVIYLDNNLVVKDRVKKNYRIREIDDKLRKFRTKREAKIIEKLPVSKPALVKVSDEKMQIEMEYIKGNLLRDFLTEKNCAKLCREIGKDVAKIHDAGIIHGDLTTSNLILKENKIYFIDFGLSFFSDKIEDKAVDIHLLRQALESKHYNFWEKAFKSFLEGYKANSKYKEVLNRLEKVEARGRYKGKG